MRDKYYILLSVIIISVILIFNLILIIISRNNTNDNLINYDNELINIEQKILEQKPTGEKKYYYLIEKNLVNSAGKEIYKTKFSGTGVIIYDNTTVKIYIQNDANHCYIRENGINKIDNGKCIIKDNYAVGYQRILDTSISNQLKNDNISSLPFDSKQYYYGINPNNYLIFENSCYRIINVAQNNSLKIIYESDINNFNNCYYSENGNIGYVALMAWNNSALEKPRWASSYLQNKMSDWGNENKIDMINIKVKLDMKKIISADWNVGEITKKNTDIENLLLEERKEKYNAKMGLINISDYIKASGENQLILDKNYKNSYLYKPNYDYWTISSLNSNKDKMAWQITLNGLIEPMTISYSKEYSYSGVRPVMYLKSDLKLSGTGTAVNPYIIINN